MNYNMALKEFHKLFLIPQQCKHYSSHVSIFGSNNSGFKVRRIPGKFLRPGIVSSVEQDSSPPPPQITSEKGQSPSINAT